VFKHANIESLFGEAVSSAPHCKATLRNHTASLARCLLQLQHCIL